MSSCTVFVFLSLIEYAFVNVMMGDISEVERKDKASHLRSIIVTANHVPYMHGHSHGHGGHGDLGVHPSQVSMHQQRMEDKQLEQKVKRPFYISLSFR